MSSGEDTRAAAAGDPAPPPPAGVMPPAPGADPLADGVERPLDPRQVGLERLQCWIVVAVLAGGSGLGLALLLALRSPPGWAALALVAAWLLVAGLLCWWAARWPDLWYRHAAWSLDDTGLRLRSGVWWRSETFVPRSRVQHTDVTQGPLQRGRGLGTLVVHTAGVHHAQVSLEGLDHGLALQLRDRLLPRGTGDVV